MSAYEYHSLPHDFNDNDIDVVIRRGPDWWRWEGAATKNGHFLYQECTMHSLAELKKSMARELGLHPDTKYKRILVK